MVEAKNKYSLWLVPKGEAGEKLQSLADQLANEQGSPQFMPHMTLVANIIADATELQMAKDHITSLAQQIGSFSVTLAEYGYMDEEFRCLYLLAQSSRELTAVYEAAAQLFPQVRDEHFMAMPHLSLMYGDFPETTKQQLIVEHPLEPVTFTADSVDLYLTNDPVSSWRLEASTYTSSRISD